MMVLSKKEKQLQQDWMHGYCTGVREDTPMLGCNAYYEAGYERGRDHVLIAWEAAARAARNPVLVAHVVKEGADD